MTAVAIDPSPGAPTHGCHCAPSGSTLPPPPDYLPDYVPDYVLDDRLGPDDMFDPDVDNPFDELPPMSRVDGLEWELWAGVEQDEAEREMLRRTAPAWVFLPPGAELAAALEELRPQCESPIALIEAMKAAARMEAWAASIKTAAMASFVRQRKAQATEIPRPTQIDTTGRPIDPERSWAAEIAAALHLSANTAARHIDTALHLTGPLAATHTALRCGALTWSKALAISEATRTLDNQSAQAVEAHVLRRAPGQTHTNLAKSLRRQVAKHTTAGDADRHRAAVADRTCKIVPLADGMAGLWVVHTADKIQQMWIVIQAMADLAKRGTPATADATTTGTATTGTGTTGTATTGTGTGTSATGTSATSATSGTARPARPAPPLRPLRPPRPPRPPTEATTTATATATASGPARPSRQAPDPPRTPRPTLKPPTPRPSPARACAAPPQPPPRATPAKKPPPGAPGATPPDPSRQPPPAGSPPTPRPARSRVKRPGTSGPPSSGAPTS